MLEDGLKSGDTKSAGYLAYDAYKKRAHFPDFVNDAVEAALGVMHRKPAVVEVPTRMEPILERATPRGEPLQLLLQRITEQQLVPGRCGLLVDFPENAGLGDIVPYIAMYNAPSILNWDVGRRDGLETQILNFLALDESEFERDQDFEWEFREKTRVLILGETLANEASGAYSVGVYREDEGTSFTESKQLVPSLRGRTIDFIPWTFVNSKDLVAEPEEPPLLGLAELALTVYRGEADYRQNLFMQAQDTLVIIGAGEDDDDIGTGANRVIHVPQGGDAKFVGVSSTGLPEQRQALMNDRKMAADKGAQILATGSGSERESGEALKMRISAQTATLTQVAIAGAAGLQQSLRHAAEWMGLNPNDVTVEPNLEFADDPLTGDLLVKYMQAKNLGLPISLQTIHENLRKRDFTGLTFEEETELIIEEIEDAIARTPTGTGDPVEDPERDPEEDA
jgi:hypothetical protein